MINLSPPKIKEEIKYGRLNVSILRYVSGGVIAGLVVTVIVFGGLWFIRDHKADLQSSLDSKSATFDTYADTLKEASDLSSTINTISSLLDREILFSDLLDDIAALIPDGATLEGISLSNADDSLNLSATLDKKELAAVFQKNLAESSLFREASLISVTKTADDDFAASYTVVFTGKEPAVKVEPEVPDTQVQP